MTFQPLQVKFFGNGCKILNYYNLKSSPVYSIPKDSRSDWLTNNNKYIPRNNEETKTKSNFVYTELYNTREQYINESKKAKAPSYSFGKSGIKEDELYTKTKIKKRAKSSKNKNINFDEENLKGDNCQNNENTNLEKEQKHNQYYEIGTKFVNESRQPKAPLYSFAGGPFNTNYRTQSIINNNFTSPNDFYETRRDYIHESKKPRIVGYSFWKQKRIDPNIKKKWKYNFYRNKNENNKNNDFKEENNFDKGDNCPNQNEGEKDIKNKKNKIKKNNKKENNLKNNSKDLPHDYYNLREHYIYESQKPRVVGYSFGKTSGVKPKIIKGKSGEDTFFYNLREHYINESQKPKAPKYSFGRPRSFIPMKNNKNIKYKIRPQSAVLNHNFKIQLEEEKNNKFKNNNKNNGPGPGSYYIEGNIGENAVKISLSPYGRKNPKNNGFPGPDYYYPSYKLTQKQYPNYSIGTSERDGCYEGYYPINNSMNLSYGSQYYRRNPSWIISKKSKGDFINRICNENLRYK